MVAVELHTWIASRAVTIVDILDRLSAILHYLSTQKAAKLDQSSLAAVWLAGGGKLPSLLWTLSCFVGYGMKTTCVEQAFLAQVWSELRSICSRMGISDGESYAEVLKMWPKNPCSFFAKPEEIWASVCKQSPAPEAPTAVDSTSAVVVQPKCRR